MARQGVTAPPDVVATALAAVDAGMTERDAAELSGVSQPTVHRYKTGQSPQAQEGVSPMLVSSQRRERAREAFSIADLASGRARTMLSEKDERGNFKHDVRLFDATGAYKVFSEVGMQLAGEGRGTAGENALSALAACPEGRGLLANLSGFLAQAIKLQRGLPEPAIDAEVVEVEDTEEA